MKVKAFTSIMAFLFLGIVQKAIGIKFNENLMLNRYRI